MDHLCPTNIDKGKGGGNETKRLVKMMVNSKNIDSSLCKVHILIVGGIIYFFFHGFHVCAIYGPEIFKMTFYDPFKCFLYAIRFV